MLTRALNLPLLLKHKYIRLSSPCNRTSPLRPIDSMIIDAVNIKLETKVGTLGKN